MGSRTSLSAELATCSRWAGSSCGTGTAWSGATGLLMAVSSCGVSLLRISRTTSILMGSGRLSTESTTCW